MEKLKERESLLDEARKDKDYYWQEAQEMVKQLRQVHQDKLKVEMSLKETVAKIDTSQDWRFKYEQLVDKTIRMQAVAATIASNHASLVRSQERQLNILQSDSH